MTMAPPGTATSSREGPSPGAVRRRPPEPAGGVCVDDRFGVGAIGRNGSRRRGPRRRPAGADRYGTVTPTNQRLDAKVGEQVTLRVDSDTEEAVHVHSEPGHTFAVKPGAGQVFTFSVSIPGQVAIELHHSDKTIVTLQVRP